MLSSQKIIEIDELTAYFKEHPEEEEEFINEIARLHENDEPVDYPEDWNMRGA